MLQPAETWNADDARISVLLHAVLGRVAVERLMRVSLAYFAAELLP